MRIQDEDYAYGQWKQKQIDEGVYRLKQRKQQQPVIGSALPDSEKVVRFARKDPNPHIPFVDPSFPKMQRWEKIAWAAAVGFWLTILFLNPFGWSW